MDETLFEQLTPEQQAAELRRALTLPLSPMPLRSKKKGTEPIMTIKTPNGFEYLIAVLNMRPFKRPATHHVLIMLTKFRNSKTGLCCPSLKRLMECTGFAKRTILLELAELRKSGVLTHKKGWGNDHARGIPNRYTLSLSKIKGLALAGTVVAPSNEAGAKDDEAGATGNEAGATDGTCLTKQVQLLHQAGAFTAPLTMKVIMEQCHNSEEKTNCEGENGEGADGSEKCDQEVFEEPVSPDSLTKPPQAAKSNQEVFEETEEAFDNPQNPTIDSFCFIECSVHCVVRIALKPVDRFEILWQLFVGDAADGAL